MSKCDITFSNREFEIIVITLCSGIAGILIGKVITHRWFNNLLRFLHIERTTNANIWDDLIKPGTWLHIYLKDGTSFYGEYYYGEPFEKEPLIALWKYDHFDKDNNLILSTKDDRNSLILLNTKDFEKLYIVYTDEIKQYDIQDGWDAIKRHFTINRLE